MNHERLWLSDYIRGDRCMSGKCEDCGKDLRPAPARFDGEPAIVGYLPCGCRNRPKNPWDVVCGLCGEWKDLGPDFMLNHGDAVIGDVLDGDWLVCDRMNWTPEQRARHGIA